MKMFRLYGWFLVFAALLVQGCSGESVKETETQGEVVTGAEAPPETTPGGEGTTGGVESWVAAEATTAQIGEQLTVDALSDPQSLLYKRTFYFGLDSSTVSQDDHAALDFHARFLVANPEISLVVEGHGDERGSREYNLALGERRAKAVERLLLLQGGSSSQLQIISFGEERPVALGHDEEAWQLNRRVELLYSGY